MDKANIFNNIISQLDTFELKDVLSFLMSKYAPGDILSYYANNDNIDIRKCVCRNSNTSQELLTKLYENDELKLFVIENANCPREILNSLIDSNDKVIYSHMMKNKTCPKKLFRMIDEIDLSNPVCPKDVLLKYSIKASELNMKELSCLASNTSMTNEELNMVFDSKLGFTARYAFASNINCPSDILLKIYDKNNNDELKYLIYKNPNCPKELINAEIKKSNVDINVLRSIAFNPSIEENILNKLSMIEDEVILMNLALNKSFNNLVLLSNSNYSSVRMNTLLNDNVSLEILQSLINDSDKYISLMANFRLYNYLYNQGIVNIEEKEDYSKEERHEENDSYELGIEKLNDIKDKLHRDRENETLRLVKELMSILVHVDKPDENYTIRRLYHTIDIDEETLFNINPDGSKEIKKEYIPILRYFDLSNIKSDNMIASDIDFRFTNINIDPQKVFNKDLSYSRFSDNNIHKYRSLEGVNMSGADISETRLSVSKKENIESNKMKDSVSSLGAEVKN